MSKYTLYIKVKLEAEDVNEAIDKLDEWLNVAEDNLALPGKGISISIGDGLLDDNDLSPAGASAANPGANGTL